MYYTYMIRCIDNSIYTGITTDLERRYNEHLNKDKNCAKYTYRHQVIKLEIAWESESRSTASKLEYNIKKLSKKDKEEIIKNENLDILSSKIEIEKYKNV